MRGPAALVLAAALLLPARGVLADLLTEAIGADAAAQGDTEERIRLIFAHRLAGDGAALAGDAAALAARDALRRDAGLPPTGLTDDARYLAAALAPTRDARRDALHEVLATHPDPVVRRLADYQLDNADDGGAADRLLTDDRHNRRAAVVNDAIRPFGLFSGLTALGALNPFLLAGSALDSVATTAGNLWRYNSLSAPEREALARYRTLLAREPFTEDAPEVARAIRRLGAKRARSLCDGSVDLGKKTLAADDLDHATFYLEAAARQEGCADAAARPLAKLDEARTRHAAREDAARWPVDDPPRPEPGSETEDYEALAVTTALGEPGAMVQEARRFEERHDDSPFTPSARYVLAVARHLAGHREEGRSVLAALAGDDSSVGRHAAAVLASADYDRLDALHEAERHHTRDTVRYVLLGGSQDGRTALYTATQLGAGGLRAAQSLGLFNVIGVLTRAWQAWWHDPVSNQAIIDRGEQLLARDPHGPDAAEVHARLAEAYERAGSYGRALMHYQATPDPSPEEIARLEGKLADDLLQTAERDHGDPVLLDGIVRHFGATKAGATAREKLAALPPPGDTVIPRQVLAANPALFGPDALDLEPTLLDGERANGELADAGVTLVDGGLRLTLADTDGRGQHTESRPLSPDTYARAKAAAQEALYTRLLTAEQRDPETGRFERYIPVYLQGSVDDGGGVYVSPGIKMRRYHSADSSLYE